MGVPDDDPRLLAVIALADPELTGPTVRRRVSRIRLHEVADPVDAMYLGIAAEKAGDFAPGAAFLARAVERLREQGRLGMLTQALVHYAWAAMHAGDWAAAAAAGAEARGLARDTHQPQYGLTGELVAALAAALRGIEPDVAGRLAEPERTLRAMNGGPLLAPAHLARGAAALGDGRHEEAFATCGPCSTKPLRHFIASCAGRRSSTWSRPGCAADNPSGCRCLPSWRRSPRGANHPCCCVRLTCARPLIGR